jgi:hypothetical protein
LYSGQNRIGITTNPVYITYSTVLPSEFVPEPPKVVVKEVIKEVPIEKVVVKEILKYNIKGEGVLFKIWYWVGEKMRWIYGR